MELTKLRYFYEVAKYGHVTKAAEEIHIAQPALTKAIKLLEEELGVPLFYKKGRNVYLTVYGEYLKGRVESILRRVDAIPAEIEILKGEQNHTVRLNVLAASTLVTDAVISYKKTHPEVIFQLIQNETEGDCDISVSMQSEQSIALPPFLKRNIFKEQIFLAVPKRSAFAARTEIALREAKDEGFVILAGSRMFRAVCDSFCAYAGFKPRTSFESDSPIAVHNIIGAGAGVGFWPEYSWGAVSDDMVLLSITEPVCQRSIVLGLHESPTVSDAAQEFYPYLVRFLQQCGKKKS